MLKQLKKKNKESISIESLNKDQLENESVEQWRQTIQEFMKKYMKLFLHKKIETPFAYTNPIAEQVTFDNQVLNVTWVGDRKLQVFGLKKDLNELKANLNLISSTEQF